MAAGEREDFLAWFLDADVGSDDAVRQLRERTGRGGLGQLIADDELAVYEPEAVEIARRDRLRSIEGVIGDMRAERGRHIVRGNVRREEFVDYYRRVQLDLWAAQKGHAREMAYPAHKKLGAAYAILSKYTDDIRVDVERHWVAWPARAARPRVPAIDVPGHETRVTLSLVGELAWAMFEKVRRAQSHITCPYCGRVELFPDPRPRKICGRASCRSNYVRDYQRAHDKSTPRVQKHRAKKGGRDGKTRKR